MDNWLLYLFLAPFIVVAWVGVIAVGYYIVSDAIYDGPRATRKRREMVEKIAYLERELGKVTKK